MSTMSEIALEDLCRKVTDGTHDSPKLLPEGVPFIKGKHISSGVIDFENCDHISYEDHLKVISRSMPENGDTLFSNIGSVGDSVFVDTDIEFSIKNVALFKPDPTKVIPRYLYYLLRSPEVLGGLLSQRSGSAQPFIGLSTLRQHKVKFHKNLDTQAHVVYVLSSYDDLIENNTRRIQILEEMVRRLYEEWFVHFRYPRYEEVSFKDSELGKIPEGWNVTAVKPLINRLKNGTVYKQKDVEASGSTIVIDQSRSEYLGFHSNEPDHEANDKSPIVIFGDHTCKMQIMVNPFSLGPNTIAFTGKTQHSLYYIFSLVKGLINTHEYKRHWSDFMGKKIVAAPVELSDKYAETVGPMFHQIELMRRKIWNLRAQRDLLLPKLVSGEIDVSDIPMPDDKEVEAA